MLYGQSYRATKRERAKRTDKTTYGKWDDKLDEVNPVIVRCLKEHKSKTM